MASVQKKIVRDKNTAVITVSGEFLFDQIVDVSKQFYSSEITLNIIFDLTEADISALTAVQMEEMIEIGKKHAHLREGGKTAFVISGDLNYGLVRMYETFSELRNHPIANAVFKNMDEAMTWLEQ